MSCAAVLACAAVIVPAAPASHSVTEIVSYAPGFNSFTDAAMAGVSEDGLHAYIKTYQPLIPEDVDGQYDIYERYGTTVRLVSTGVNFSNGEYEANFAGATPDGEHAYFETYEPIDPYDENLARDVYERVGANTFRVSTGPSEAGLYNDSSFTAVSADGSKVLFETAAGLVPEDTDEGGDVYQRAGGVTTLISTGPGEQYFGAWAGYAGASRDAGTVFFTTVEPLAFEDTDNATDLYARSGNTTQLISTGPTSSNEDFGAEFAGATRDGQRVFFLTAERLTPADTDDEQDLYERAGQTTTLVTTGPSESAPQGSDPTWIDFGAVSTDGAHVFFTTNVGLVAADTDGRFDVYDRTGGATTLVTSGSVGTGGAFFLGASDDSAHVFFDSNMRFVAGDTDDCFAFPEGDSRGCTDVYERFGGTTTLVSAPAGAPQDLDSYFGGNSADGTRAFFYTSERLVASDTDQGADVYERHAGTTSLLSGNGDANTWVSGLARDGSRVFFPTTDSLVQHDLDGFHSDVYAADLVPGPATPYPRPRGAAIVKVPLVPAYEPCEAMNGTHGPPLAFESCNPPLKSSFQLTVGTPDANGAAANSAGFAQYRAIVGAPGAPDDSDVEIRAQLTDVRCEPDSNPAGCGAANSLGGADFAGTLRLTAALRMTDRLNGGTGGGSEAGTTKDLSLPAALPCTSTPSTAEGGSCTVATTANALSPGVVKDGKRAVWDIGKILILHPASNDLFAAQGLFVP